MGFGRLWHPNWLTRYVYGTWAVLQTSNTLAEWQYQIPRARDLNHKWTFWAEFNNKKRAGEIPHDMPGYMYCKWQNGQEKAWWQNHGREYEGFPAPE